MVAINRILIPLTALLIGLGPAVHGQASTLTSKQLAYFDSLFRMVGDPAQETSTLQRREGVIIGRFALDPAEGGALHAAAVQYFAFALQANESLRSVSEGKTELSASERAAISTIAAKRSAAISQLATSFLGKLKPEAASRIITFISKERQQ